MYIYIINVSTYMLNHFITTNFSNHHDAISLYCVAWADVGDVFNKKWIRCGIVLESESMMILMLSLGISGSKTGATFVPYFRPYFFLKKSLDLRNRPWTYGKSVPSINRRMASSVSGITASRLTWEIENDGDRSPAWHLLMINYFMEIISMSIGDNYNLYTLNWEKSIREIITMIKYSKGHDSKEYMKYHLQEYPGNSVFFRRIPDDLFEKLSGLPRFGEDWMP